MSATAEAPPQATAHDVGHGRPSLPRLTLVELRKFADTRAGFWLLLLLFVLTVGLVALQLGAGTQRERSLAELFDSLQFPISILLPVLAILLVSSEWTQRTALTTFTLVPQRGRVVAAKAAAVVVITLAALAVSLLAAAAGQALIPVLFPEEGSWRMGLTLVGHAFVFQLFGIAMGFAFALALQRSAPAIVLYFILPLVWSAAVGLVPSIREAGQWIDTSANLLPLITGGMDGDAWLRVGASAVLWILVPLIIGLLRLRRSELK